MHDPIQFWDNKHVNRKKVIQGMLPYDVRKKLSKEDCPRLRSDKLDESRYPSAVGSLMYALLCAKPNLA